MNLLPEEAKEVIVKWLARAMGGPKMLARTSAIAMLSVVETLMVLANYTLVGDIRRIKEAQLRVIDAGARAAEAESARKVAEAAEAANKATLLKRNNATKLAELRLQNADAAKTEAEAEAIRMDAETRRLAAIEDAKANLIEKLSKLRMDGGELLIDRANLARLLAAPMPDAKSVVNSSDSK